jgi:hypothetical protein
MLMVSVPPSEVGEPEMFTSVPVVPRDVVKDEFTRFALVMVPAATLLPVIVPSAISADVMDPSTILVLSTELPAKSTRAIEPSVMSADVMSPDDKRPRALFFTTPAVENAEMVGASAKVVVLDDESVVNAPDPPLVACAVKVLAAVT